MLKEIFTEKKALLAARVEHELETVKQVRSQNYILTAVKLLIAARSRLLLRSSNGINDMR